MQTETKYPKRNHKKPDYYNSEVELDNKSKMTTKSKCKTYVHKSTFIKKADLKKKLDVTENDLIQSRTYVIELICKLEWYSKNCTLTPPWKRGIKRSSLSR